MHTTTQGLPNSSSQCIVGGIVGVGMLEGTTGVNWRFMGALWVIEAPALPQTHQSTPRILSADQFTI